MQYTALEEKATSEFHDLIYFFANKFGIDVSPDTLRHHLDIIQTSSDTIQTPPDIGIFQRQRVLEERAISEYGLIQILPMDLVLLYPETSSVLRLIPDTKQTPPDTIQTPPIIGVLCNIGHWKKRQYLSFMTFYNILLRDLVFMHPRQPETPSRHYPDTIQTPSHRHFYVI